MAVKCILFDADGVVINAELFSMQYEKKYGVSNDEMIPFCKGDFQKCVVGQLDLIEEIMPWLVKWKWKGTAEEFLQFWFKSGHSTDEQVIKAIKELRKKKIKCYLATNQEKHRAQYLREQMGFDKLFDGLFLSTNIGYKKPDREFYEFILDDLKNRHEICPQEIIFFDDKQQNINEAKKFGIEAYFYKNFEEFEAVLRTTLNQKFL